jgi:hypothetical protein
MRFSLTNPENEQETTFTPRLNSDAIHLMVDQLRSGKEYFIKIIIKRVIKAFIFLVQKSFQFSKYQLKIAFALLT